MIDFELVTYVNSGQWWYFALIFGAIPVISMGAFCIYTISDEGPRFSLFLGIVFAVTYTVSAIFFITNASISEDTKLRQTFIENSVTLVSDMDFNSPFSVRDSSGNLLQCNMLSYDSTRFRVLCEK